MTVIVIKVILIAISVTVTIVTVFYFLLLVVQYCSVLCGVLQIQLRRKDENSQYDMMLV